MRLTLGSKGQNLILNFVHFSFHLHCWTEINQICCIVSLCLGSYSTTAIIALDPKACVCVCVWGGGGGGGEGGDKRSALGPDSVLSPCLLKLLGRFNHICCIVALCLGSLLKLLDRFNHICCIVALCLGSFNTTVITALDLRVRVSTLDTVFCSLVHLWQISTYLINSILMARVIHY